VRESLVEELSPSFEVTPVDGAEAALEELNQRRFDLLLSDVRMPGMDGVELARRARSLDPDMMRVLLTGYSDEDARRAVWERDGVYKLHKPWNDDLESVLLRALEHRERLHRIGEMMEQMDRLASLGRMLMSVIHDMSSPLSYVQANVSTLARDLVPALSNGDTSMDSSEVGELLSDVNTGVSKIVNLVHRLRQYAAPAERSSTLVGLARVIDGAIDVTRGQFRHRVAIDLHKEDEGALVAAEARDLEQIVVNLLLNAAQVMDWKGTVKLEVKAANGHALVSVTDEGPGIPADRVERIFDPLFAEPGAGVGHGLALAVSRKLAERCGGRLRVQSGAGCGSTFTLELPRAKPN